MLIPQPKQNNINKHAGIRPARSFPVSLFPLDHNFYGLTLSLLNSSWPLDSDSCFERFLQREQLWWAQLNVFFQQIPCNTGPWDFLPKSPSPGGTLNTFPDGNRLGTSPAMCCTEFTLWPIQSDYKNCKMGTVSCKPQWKLRIIGFLTSTAQRIPSIGRSSLLTVPNNAHTPSGIPGICAVNPLVTNKWPKQHLRKRCQWPHHMTHHWAGDSRCNTKWGGWLFAFHTVFP